jgi:trigger factor
MPGSAQRDVPGPSAAPQAPVSKEIPAVKSAVETLNPTRVRLTVEVPFEELKPSLDQAYRKIAQQVTIPGFRRGKVPARLIDQRFGRGVVLEEAVNDALPRFYGQAVQENSVQVVGQPNVDVTEVPDPSAGGELKFTAEVDVRPKIELPAYEGLEVTVDDAEVTDADIDEQLQNLRERFGSLRGVDRPAQDGDFVSLDLSGTVEGKPVEDLGAKGLSYQVGSGSLLDRLDETIVGLSAGQSATFTAPMTVEEYAGKDAEVTVTVNSVKERDLPDLDDDFAQTASEFDTLEELRDDLRTRLERMKKVEQGVQARDRALQALLARVEVPLPESIVTTELEGRHATMTSQLQAAGLTKEEYLDSEGQSAEDFDAEVEHHAREAIKAQLLLDTIAAKEQLEVAQDELTEHLLRRATRLGMSPEQFANEIVSAGQVQVLISEVIRGKALARVLESAKVTDASGRSVDLAALGEGTVAEGTTLATEGAGGDVPTEDQPSPTEDQRSATEEQPTATEPVATEPTATVRPAGTEQPAGSGAPVPDTEERAIT